MRDMLSKLRARVSSQENTKNGWVLDKSATIKTSESSTRATRKKKRVKNSKEQSKTPIALDKPNRSLKLFSLSKILTTNNFTICKTRSRTKKTRKF